MDQKEKLMKQLGVMVGVAIGGPVFNTMVILVTTIMHLREGRPVFHQLYFWMWGFAVVGSWGLFFIGLAKADLKLMTRKKFLELQSQHHEKDDE